MDIPILRTERLVITAPGADDADALLEYTRKNHAFHAPWSPPLSPSWSTIENARARIAKMHALWADGTGCALWLRSAAAPKGPFLGATNLNQVFMGARRVALLGYHVDEDHQGKGLAFEAIGAVIRYAFETLRLHRIEANHVPENTRSAAVLKRHGFEREGYARDYLFIGGRFRDHVLNALVNDHLVDALALCTPP